MLNPKGTNRKYFYNEKIEHYEDGHNSYDEVDGPGANLVSSLCEDGFHRPALDIDLPAEIFQSSTPGHCHLYIDQPMTWVKYVKLMTVLVEVGLLDKRYLNHSLERGQTLLRLPHIRKEAKEFKPTVDLCTGKLLCECEKCI